MNILFCSVPFRPSVGGIETVSALMAERFQRAGHQVVLVTQTPEGGSPGEADAFAVESRPSARRMLQLVRWADVVFHNNISLRFAWPQLLVRRPWVVAHHTWIPREGVAASLKRLALKRAQNIAVSRAMAASLPVRSALIPNPYADDLFVVDERVPRSEQLVFVGRLVSDKGVDVLLDALGLLALAGRRIGLTIVGDGPEAPALRAQAAKLGIGDQLVFAGRRAGPELVRLLNRHQVLVVPSVWEEPFGVVVLEALACGCVPLVTRSGGLPDAVGECGVVVAKSDSEALAHAIGELVDNRRALARCREGSQAHLARHTRDRVAQAYLQVIDDARRTHSTASTAAVL